MARVDEGARDEITQGCVPNVIIIIDRKALIHTPHASRLCGDAEFMGSIWQRYDALATDSDAGSASGARVFTPFIATLRHLLTSRPLLPGVSTQIPGVGVPASDSMAYPHSHSWDSFAGIVTTAASAAVSKVIGMTRTDAGLSVKNAAMKVQLQWSVLFPSPHLAPRHPFLLTASTSSTRKTRRPSLKRTYTSSAYNASSRSVTASQGTRSPFTTASQSRSPSPDRRSPCARQARSTVNATRIRARPRWSADSARDGYNRLARTAPRSLLPFHHQPFRLPVWPCP